MVHRNPIQSTRNLSNERFKDSIEMQDAQVRADSYIDPYLGNRELQERRKHRTCS